MTGPIAQAPFHGPFSTLTIIAAALSLIVPVSSAHAQGQRTAGEMQRLSPDTANRVSQEDLLSVLEPGGKIALGTHSPPRTKLTTKSYGTQFDGVCRRDVLALLYAPAKAGDSPWSAPLRPYGIEAMPMFRIVHLPKIAPGLDDFSSPLVAQPDCKDVEGQWRKRKLAEGVEKDMLDFGPEWFTAPDAAHAVQAGFAVDMALAQVKAGTLKPEPCPDVERFGRTCIGQILGTGLTDIYAVETCPAPTGSVCYAVYFMHASAVLTIKALVDDGKIVPNRILSIAVEDFVCILIRRDGRCVL